MKAACPAVGLTVALGLLTLPAQTPNFKADVKLVRLLVNVKDSQEKPVGSLEAEDFSVVDCGVKQEIKVFERQTELPLSVSLLVDTSGSTARDLHYEVTSAEKFFKALIGEGNPKDAASLYSFNFEVSQVRGFTRQLRRLSEDLKTLHGDAGTSLYDAILLASRDLGDRDGRHVIVVVTDGGDTTSTSRYARALEAAHLAGAVVFPILVVPVTNNAGRNIGGENALTQIAHDTGGRVFELSGGAALDRAFTDILKELRTQYLIAYYPKGLPPDAPRFHPVRVEMSRPDLRPQTRTGYYGDSPR